jgi:CheY-like chemotaxis protein
MNATTSAPDDRTQLLLDEQAGRHRAQAAGFDEHLVKPVDPTELAMRFATA